MINKLVSAILLIVLLIACNSKKKVNIESSYTLESKLTKLADYDEGYPIADEEIDSNAPYLAEEYIKYYHDYYKDKTVPPLLIIKLI